MNSKVLLIAIASLVSGFTIAFFAFQFQSTAGKPETAISHPGNQSTDTVVPEANPFLPLYKKPQETSPPATDRLITAEEEIALIKQQISTMQHELTELKASIAENTSSARQPSPATPARSLLNRRLFNYENLVKGGIEPGIAEDIARRKNAVELKRLELQDRATRGDYLDSRRYYDELEAINSQDISLRDELGDDLYDEYLYNSKQNNRVRIVGVIANSTAEQAGIHKNDIVLSYDNKRMFTWDELKAMTSEGQLGEYVAISIYRNGEIYSFSVPRGPLGIQLGATRIPP